MKPSTLFPLCVFLALAHVAYCSKIDSTSSTIEIDEIPSAETDAATYKDNTQHRDNNYDDETLPRVKVTAHFPDNPFFMIANGEVTSVLLGIENYSSSGGQSVQVIAVNARFTQPGQYENVVRNITKFNYYAEVKPNEIATVNYRLRASIDPGQIGLVIDVDIADKKNRIYKVKALEKDMTVDENYSSNKWDLQSIMIYAFSAGLILFVLILVQKAFVTGKNSVWNKARRASDDKKKASDQNKKVPVGFEWIPQEHLTKSTSKKRR